MHLTHRRGGRDRSRPRAGARDRRPRRRPLGGRDELDRRGLVVDLRAMNSVEVDVAARTVHVAGGATMSDLDRALAPHGLVAVGGRVSTTGVGVSPSGAEPAGWTASSGWPATTCSRSSLSPRPGISSPPASMRTPSCSGRYTVAAATSAWPFREARPRAAALPPPRPRPARGLLRGRARLRGGGGCPAAATAGGPGSPPRRPHSRRRTCGSVRARRSPMGGTQPVRRAPPPPRTAHGATPRAARAPR